MILRVGEIRQIGIEVVSQIAQDFVIETADYEVKKKDEVLDEGAATIDGHKILSLFTAQTPGQFDVFYTYRIGPEVIKAKVYVEVIK